MKKGKDFFAIALYITFTRRIRERGERVPDKSHYVIKIASGNFSVFIFFSEFQAQYTTDFSLWDISRSN